ncbi:MAG: hypothetical protein H6Q73_3584 [Firmicutes bacterium]|nr:hypothetical protein [Bacillota bacterium]
MSYNTQEMIKDAGSKLIPQYYNKVEDAYEPVMGHGGSILINSVQTPVREDFSGTALDSSNWSSTIGSGHTVSVASSVLTLATGTTASTETILTFNTPFTIPFRAQFIYYLSQRIANQEFYFEVINSAGDMYAQWLLDGTTATYGKYVACNAGTVNSTSSATILTSASYSVAEIELCLDETYYSSRYVDSVSGVAVRYLKNRLIPDPTQEYYVRIRAKNLSTAPASTTKLCVDAVLIQDITELTAEVTGGRGNTNISQAIPMYSTGGYLSSVSTAYCVNKLTFYTDTSTALAASATYTGTSRDTGSTGLYSKFRARAYSDQAGTLYIDQSKDASTWYSTTSASVTAASAKLIEETIVARYVRVRYVNSTTAQTTFELVSVLVPM